MYTTIESQISTFQHSHQNIVKLDIRNLQRKTNEKVLNVGFLSFSHRILVIRGVRLQIGLALIFYQKKIIYKEY